MQPNRDPSQSNGPVMDVQRPTVSSPPPSSDGMIRPNANSLGRPATMEYTRPRPIDAADPTGPSTSFAPPSEASRAQSPVIGKPKRSKAPLFIVLLLIVLAAGAAGAYYFLVMNKTETPAVVQPVVVEEKTTTIEATPEGVDTTVESIDKNLNSVDDTQDFTPNDVSDDALGL